MAKWNIELDGKKYTLEGGDVAPTEDEARSAIGEYSKSTESYPGISKKTDDMVKSAMGSSLDMIPGVVNAAGEGATYNRMNKINAGMDASTGYIARKLGNVTGLTPHSDKSWRDLYKTELEQNIAKEKEFSAEHPVADVVGNITGSFAAPLSKFGAPIKGAGAVKNILKGAATGAVTGALYGSGRGDNINDNISNAVSDAKFGGVVGAAFPAIGALGKLAVATTSGTGLKAVDNMLEAGAKSSKEALKNMRGEVPLTDVVDMAERAKNAIKKESMDAYKREFERFGQNKQLFDTSKINSALEDTYNGVSKLDIASGSDTVKHLDRLSNLIKAFNKTTKPTFEGLNNLKKGVDDLIESTKDNNRAKSLLLNIKNSIKDTIEEQAPGYKETMGQYGRVNSLLKEIKSELGTGSKSTATQKLGKLQSSLRENAATKYGEKFNLVKKLNSKTDDKLLDSITGQQFSSILPRGLVSNIGALGAGMSTFTGGLGNLLMLPAFSPRIVGEAAYKMGQLGNKLPDNTRQRVLNAILSAKGE